MTSPRAPSERLAPTPLRPCIRAWSPTAARGRPPAPSLSGRTPLHTYVVGYGTLLYRRSLGDSIGQAPAGERVVIPVVIPGYRRLFNLRAEHYRSSNRLGRAPIENGAMNVEPDPAASFNGLAFRVTEVELEILDARERYYLRLVAPAHDFDTRELVGEGHFYSAAVDAEWLERDPGRLLPLWRDIVWARRGAYAIGEAFGRYFDETTYLADGRTRVVDHYANLLEDLHGPLGA